MSDENEHVFINYIISQICTFSLVLSYDQMEDTHITDEVIDVWFCL